MFQHCSTKCPVFVSLWLQNKGSNLRSDLICSDRQTGAAVLSCLCEIRMAQRVDRTSCTTLFFTLRIRNLKTNMGLIHLEKLLLLQTTHMLKASGGVKHLFDSITECM
ncbi:hypothetical protein AMECASPLE_004511 [Ameca splendens]|uniref:Uncharacterized protein n=1 Tax=Ameca splendens TaxID=208324 RepID=A0ABV0Z8J7_9TELE